MEKRVRITNDSLNSYGFRVLTKGVDISQFQRNPVLLYMHNRGDVIGTVKDIQVSDNEITGRLAFDCATCLSETCQRQWEAGSLRMVSMGFDILEMSDDPKFLLPGQTRPTVTKAKLFEVSLVDIAANDDCLVLRRNGELVTLGINGECSLPLLNPITATIATASTDYNQNNNIMDLKTLALALGLTDNATEEEVLSCATQLKNNYDEQCARFEELNARFEQLALKQLEQLVDNAVNDKKINNEQKTHFIELGKKVGIDDLKITLDAMQPQVKLSQFINPADDNAKTQWSKLSDVPAEQLVELRKNNPDTYKELFKKEYGFVPTLN